MKNKIIILAAVTLFIPAVSFADGLEGYGAAGQNASDRAFQQYQQNQQRPEYQSQPSQPRSKGVKVHLQTRGEHSYFDAGSGTVFNVSFNCRVNADDGIDAIYVKQRSTYHVGELFFSGGRQCGVVGTQKM